MKQTVKLKKLKGRRKKLQWTLQKLEAKVESCQNKVNDKIRDNIQNYVSIEGKWKIFKKAVLEAPKAAIGYRTGTEDTILAKSPGTLRKFLIWMAHSPPSPLTMLVFERSTCRNGKKFSCTITPNVSGTDQHCIRGKGGA